MLINRERSDIEKQLKIIVKQHKEEIHVFIKHKIQYTQNHPILPGEIGVGSSNKERR